MTGKARGKEEDCVQQITSEAQHSLDGLARKHEEQDFGGVDMNGGKIMGILGKGC